MLPQNPLEPWSEVWLTSVYSRWSRLDSRECEMTARTRGFPTVLRVGGRLGLPLCRIQTGDLKARRRRDKRGGRALTVLSG